MGIFNYADLAEASRAIDAATAELGSNRRRRKPASSGRTAYNTPQKVLDCLAQMGPIACDPCWNPRSLVRAEVTYTEEQDGLAQEWPKGLVYSNPPYGRPLKALWVPKYIEQKSSLREIVVLVPNSCEAWYFERLLEVCDAALAIRGRLTFDGEKDPAFFGSALFYLGTQPYRFQRAFLPLGYMLKGGQ